MVLMAHEFTAEARLCFEHAERLDPTEGRWPYLLALLLSQENAAGAIDKLQRTVNIGRDRQDAPRLRLAQTLFEEGRLDEAEGHFRTLLRLNAGHAAAQIGLAELSHVRGRVEETRRLLPLCLTNAYTAKRAHTLLAQVERQLGNTAGAEAALRDAAVLSADLPWPDLFFADAARFRIGRKAWADQAQSWLDQGRHEDAQPIVARLIQDYPGAPDGWLLLGRMRLERNDCAGAEQCFRRLLQLAPEGVNGHAQLGLALLCQERYADAIPAFQQAIRLKPDFGEAHFNLGFALCGAGRASEAIEPFRQAIRHSPNFVDPYIMLADLLRQAGERQEALSLLRRALQLAPTDERAKALLQRM
jgi:tetratricopeptide (TPR) repeat protein